MSKLVDETGNIYGRWTVLKRVANHISPNGTVLAKWLCWCECGNEAEVLGVNLRSGSSTQCKSCGLKSAQQGSRNCSVRRFHKDPEFHAVFCDYYNLNPMDWRTDVPDVYRVFKDRYDLKKNSAKYKGHAFALSELDVFLRDQGQCAHCEGKRSAKRHCKKYYSVGGEKVFVTEENYYYFHEIDQIEPGAGYFKGNVQTLCQICNIIKGNQNNAVALAKCREETTAWDHSNTTKRVTNAAHQMQKQSTKTVQPTAFLANITSPTLRVNLLNGRKKNVQLSLPIRTFSKVRFSH